MGDERDVKAGQKFPTPTPGHGDRVFYETLLRQRPDSAMAQEWCVNYGVLPTKKAVKLFKIVTERKKRLRTGGTPTSTPTKPKKKAKVIRDAPDSDAEAPGAEKVGSSVI